MTNPTPSPDPVGAAASTSHDPAVADPASSATTVQRLAAEALGTFALIFFGAGAAALGTASLSGSDFGGRAGVDALAFAFALILAGYAFSRVSGGHFNPAVSIGAALSGRLAWKDAGGYVGAQVAGGVLAGAALFVLILGFDRSDAADSLYQTGFGDDLTGYAWWAAVLLELLLTAAFVILVLAVGDRRGEHPGLAALAVGFGYGAVVLAGAAATGGSANPARSLGTNLFGGVDAIIGVWPVVVGPLLGAVVAGLVYPLLFGRDGEPVAGSGLVLSGGGGRRSQAPQQYGDWQQQGYYGGDAQQGQWGQQQYYGDQYGQQQYSQQQYADPQQQGQWGQQGWGQPEQQQGWGQPEQPQQGWGQPEQSQQGWGQPEQPQQSWGQPEQAPQDQPPQGWGQEAPGGWQTQQADPAQEPTRGPAQDPSYDQGQPEQQSGDWGDSEQGGHTRMRPDQP